MNASEALLMILSDEERAKVTEAFCERLSSAMGRAGCNDVFADEFGESVAARFRSDFDVLAAWKADLAVLVPSPDAPAPEPDFSWFKGGVNKELVEEYIKLYPDTFKRGD